MEKPTKQQRKLLKHYKKTLTLTRPLFEISIGVLLGDASIQTQDGGKTYRLKFTQSQNKHSDYLRHLHSQFHDWVLSDPALDNERHMLNFQTLSHSEFTKLAEIFVLDSQGKLCKKHIKPLFVENYLTPRAFAYWIMDDGGKSCYNKDYQRKGFALNTHGFPKEEVEILCQGLRTRYSLDCWLKLNKKKWIIVISGHDYQKIMDLIGNFLIPSMYHKIPAK
jgi:hypothetical protein